MSLCYVFNSVEYNMASVIFHTFNEETLTCSTVVNSITQLIVRARNHGCDYTFRLREFVCLTYNVINFKFDLTAFPILSRSNLQVSVYIL